MDLKYLEIVTKFVRLRDNAKKIYIFLLIFTISFHISFCQQTDSSWNKFEIIPQGQDNFTVYKIRSNIFLIRERACFEDINCYLFIGEDKVLLFDTGLGLGNIKELILNLTELPIVVLNSHSHYDHIGGNYLFDSIVGVNTDFSNINDEGMTHEALLSFYKNAYSWSNNYVSCMPPNYFIHPFIKDKFVNDKDKIELGELTLEIIRTPGHTPDGLCLFDKRDSILFSGDLIYKGALFLHLPESDFTEFTNSIEKLSTIAHTIKYVMPAHGSVELEASCISILDENIHEIIDRKISFTETNGVRFYNFSYFKFLIKDLN
jgi:glyoxylase-like metal-dependent hydrolase (beta-lactamase superfamily II)